MQKEYEVTVNAKVNDEEVQGLEKYLEELQDIQLKIEADDTDIEELETEIENLREEIDVDYMMGLDTSEAEEQLEELEAQLEELKAQAESETDVNLNTGDAEEQVGNLTDSLDGLTDLAVGEMLQQYGTGAENMAQQMNQASISVGQLAKNAGMAEGDMVGLINNITNATFPQDEAMAYVQMLNQMGVSSDKLGDSATNIDKINDATGMGYQNAMQLVRGFGALGVKGDNLESTFNAVAYAQANSIGGAKDMANILKMQAGTLNEYHVGVDAATVAISDLSQKYGSARKAGAALSKSLKDNDGDLKAVEQSLGLQPGALSNATAATGKYQGKLQELADEEADHKTLLDQLGAAWEDFSLSMGGILSPLMGVVGMGGQVMGFGTQLNGTLNLLGKFKQLPQMLSGLGGLSGIFGSLGGTISGIGSSLLAFATGPVGIVIAAIIALGIAIYEVGKYFGWWSDIPSMFGAIQSGVMALWDAFMSNEYVIQAIDMIKQGLTDAWNAIVGLGQAIMSALGGAGGQFDILSWAINGLQMVLNAVGPVVVLVIQGMIQHFRNIYTVAQIVWPYIAGAIQSAIGTVTGIINGARAVFQGLVNVWNTVSSAVSSMCSAITGGLSAAGAAWESFKNMVMTAAQPILDVVHQIQSVGGDIWKIMTGGSGGFEMPISGAGSGGGNTTVSQGNTIIFNMYGDVRDEKTIDDMINAINERL
uniref:phage tail protein n=1 Tax=uncultured Methanobrevibacter sp. TaxID=253161 RepID=UPI0025EA372C